VTEKKVENAHVAGLCDKPEDTTVLLIKGPHVRCYVTIRGSKLAGERLLRYLGQIAEAIHTRPSSASDAPTPRRGAEEGSSQEEHVKHHAKSRNGEVHPLDGVERGSILSLEEIRRSDERAREGRDALEALADIKSHRSVACRAEHGDVRIGGHFEAGEAAAYDKGTADKTAVLFEFGRWPKKDGTCRLKL
jgi:hypothetical protein